MVTPTLAQAAVLASLPATQSIIGSALSQPVAFGLPSQSVQSQPSAANPSSADSSGGPASLTSSASSTGSSSSSGSSGSGAAANPAGSARPAGMVSLAGPSAVAAGISVGANGLPQMFMTSASANASGLSASGTGASSLPASLPVFVSVGAGSAVTGGGGGGNAVTALPLAVTFQSAQGGVLAAVQRSDLPTTAANSSSGPGASAGLPPLVEPGRTSPLEVTLLDGTKVTIDVGISDQALVLQLPPELTRQDAIRSGVLAALAMPGMNMANIKSVVLQQKLGQVAAR